MNRQASKAMAFGFLLAVPLILLSCLVADAEGIRTATIFIGGYILGLITVLDLLLGCRDGVIA